MSPTPKLEYEITYSTIISQNVKKESKFIRLVRTFPDEAGDSKQ